jgi:hypothetical protein
MKHTGQNTILWDYLAGKTGQEENNRIQAHLRGCSSCRKELAELEMLEDWFTLRKSEKPSSQFRESVLEKLAERNQVPAVETVFTRHDFYIVARKLAAVIVIGLITGVLLVRFSSFGKMPVNDSSENAISWSYETMTGEDDLVAYESYFLTPNSSENENQDE